MKSTVVCLFLTMLSSGLLATQARQRSCTITAEISPAAGTADHAAAPPANQVQFRVVSSVEGNCPMIADRLGSWSTSDTVNTAISNQRASAGLATCLAATENPAVITNSGSIRGRAITPATLTCK